MDECAKDNGGCHEQRKCKNAPGTMKCGDCAAGWDNDGDKKCKGLLSAIEPVLPSACTSPRVRCSDVDECAKDNGGCHKDRKCMNAPGTMKCGDCPSGLDNDGAKGCKGLSCFLSLA